MKFVEWNHDRLNEVVNLWNKELGEIFPMRAELFEQNSIQDINLFIEGSQIAVDKYNNVIGFIVAKRWQDDLNVGISREVGWIQVLLVDSKHRNQGIGKKLLAHAEYKLKASEINHVWLGKDTWHYFPGIPTQFQKTAKWFEKQGYTNEGIEFDLHCQYKHNTNLPFPLKDGIEISILKKEEEEIFINFMHRCFPGRWEYEAIQYFQRGGRGREFVILKKSGQIIGFCRINDSYSPSIAQNVYWAPLYKEELGGIGPLGIDAAERKHGYGLFIVEAAVVFLRKRDIHSIVIDWTGLVDFYNKLGFEVWKSYNTYKKSI